ncbi:MAG: PaaI family thioesterase [Pseudomonadota bacterium]
MPLKLNAEELMTLLDEVFGQVSGQFAIEDLGEMEITVRLKVGEQHLRPGGTVSGPSIFALADVGVYMAVMAMTGPEVLAVTTSSSVDFMRKPEGGRDLIAHCKLLKLGRVLAVGDVLIYSEGGHDPVARASMTYSIPPAR